MHESTCLALLFTNGPLRTESLVRLYMGGFRLAGGLLCALVVMGMFLGRTEGCQRLAWRPRYIWPWCCLPRLLFHISVLAALLGAAWVVCILAVGNWLAAIAVGLVSYGILAGGVILIWQEVWCRWSRPSGIGRFSSGCHGTADCGLWLVEPAVPIGKLFRPWGGAVQATFRKLAPRFFASICALVIIYTWCFLWTAVLASRGKIETRRAIEGVDLARPAHAVVLAGLLGFGCIGAIAILLRVGRQLREDICPSRLGRLSWMARTVLGIILLGLASVGVVTMFLSRPGVHGYFSGYGGAFLVWLLFALECCGTTVLMVDYFVAGLQGGSLQRPN